MSGRVPWWRWVLAFVMVAVFVRVVGVGLLLISTAVGGLCALFAVRHAKRWRQQHPGESYPPRPEPIDLPVAPSRLEAGLLLVTVFGLGLIAASVAIGLVFRVPASIIHGPGHDPTPDWAMLPLALGMLTAPFTFLAYAVLVSRRAGEQQPHVEQFVSRAAIRQAIARFTANTAST